MQKLYDRLVSQLKAKGMPDKEAYAVATKQLQKTGSMKPGSQELTPKGKNRQAMGASGRAKDRAAKASGHKASEFTYNQLTNRATLKGKK